MDSRCSFLFFLTENVNSFNKVTTYVSLVSRISAAAHPQKNHVDLIIDLFLSHHPLLHSPRFNVPNRMDFFPTQKKR